MSRPSRAGAFLFVFLTFAAAASAAEFAVSTPAAHRQNAPQLAAAAPYSFAVWSELRSHAFVEEIYATRLAANGRPLDGSGIPVAIETAGLTLRSLPRIATDGSGVAIVWREIREGSGALFARIVSAEGTTSEILSVGEAPAFDFPTFDITFDGRDFVAFWFHDGAIVARRIAATGTVLDPAPLLIANIGSAGEVVAEFSGTHHVVVWNAIGGSNDRDLFVASVSPLLTLRGQFAVNEETGDATRLAVAAAPSGDLLVTWTTTLPGVFPNPARNAIAATRLSSDGHARDAQALILSPLTADLDRRSAATWAIDAFRVVWHEETRNRSKLFAVTVPAAGTAGPAAELLGINASLQIGTIMASSTGTFVAYRRPDLDSGAPRAYLRSIPPFSRKRPIRR